MQRLGFGRRLFFILFLFALVPAVVLTVAWGGLLGVGLPLVSGSTAWDSVAASGARAVDAVRSQPLDSSALAALREHEEELTLSVTQARRFQFLASRAAFLTLVLAILGLGVITLVATRVAAHLSRQLSRPLDELVGWTGLIARGEPVPAAQARGAPEFATLRDSMRQMAAELEAGRARAVEAERLRVFRETAQRVAHELKNPLTPIRFAISRLKSEAPRELAETVEVLEVESGRIEQLARDFAQFGRLPDAPMSEVDVGELVRYACRATVPPEVDTKVEVQAGVPNVLGQHDSLARALTNVLLNAVQASGGGGRIEVLVGVDENGRSDARRHVRIAVRDYGTGISPDRLPHIWEPYVTNKAGGTGLGLAIARQTIESHGGSVEARSTPGEGTEIHFLLPAMGNPDAVEA